MSTQTESQNADKIKEEVRQVIRRLTELSQTQNDFDQFCGEVLDQLVDITGAHGALFWQIAGNGAPKLTHHAGNAPHDQARAIVSPENEKHTEAILDVVAQKAPVGLPSDSFLSDSNSAGDAIPFLMLFSPVLNRQQDAVGAVELIQRGEVSKQAQQGYLRFLTQIAALFQRWHERQEESSEVATRNGSLSDKLEFISEVHRSIDFKETAYAIANESRRVLGADRVSVGKWNGKTCKILSISSQDRFDNRSNVVRKLGNVATASVGADSTFWITGDTNEIAPEVVKKINEYLDESHSRTLAVIPLAIRPPDVPDLNMTKRDHKVRKLGALILEYFDDEVPQDMIREDCDLIVEQSQLALENARKHNEIFLQPLLKKLGWLQQTLFGDHLKKTITALSALGILLLAMIFMPWEMKMKVDGVLHPETRRHVYSVSKGVVTSVQFEDGDNVTAGQPLLTMIDYDREQQMQARLSEQKRLQAQLGTLATQIRQASGAGDGQRLSALESERAAIGAQLDSVEELLRNDSIMMEEMMKLSAPIDGTIITWNPQQRLNGLVVEPNQTLVSVYKMEGMWQLEVNIPQMKVGYVTRAQERVLADDDPNNDELTAVFAMSTNPNQTYEGLLQRVSIRPHTDDSGIQKYRAIIKVDPEDMDVTELKPGAGATVKIYCGKERLYKACFHQIIDWWNIQVWWF